MSESKDNVKEVVINPADVIANHKFTYAGDTFDGESLAKQAIDIQAGSDDLEDDKKSFGGKFVALAKTTTSVEEFLNVMGAIEASQSWTSKQNPNGTFKAPSVWGQYKSNVKCAWVDFNLSPQGYDTTMELNEALNTARKDKKELEDAANASEGVTNSVVSGVLLDQSLGNIFGALAKSFSESTPDTRQAMIDGLQQVFEQVEELQLIDAMEQQTAPAEEVQVQAQAS